MGGWGGTASWFFSAAADGAGGVKEGGWAARAAFPSPSMTVYEHQLQRARQKIGPHSILELSNGMMSNGNQ